MRRVIRFGFHVALAALLALPAMAFADEEAEAPKPEITWNAWGRAIFVPFVSDNNGETVPRDAASWGWDSRLGFTIKGNSENVGFWVDIKADTGSIDGLQDQQKIWVKPMDFLTVEAGPNIFYDELRGNSAYGSWDWLRFAGMNDFYGGEDNIFQRGQAGGGDGSVIRVTGDEGDVSGGAIIHADKNGMHAFAALNVVEQGALLAASDGDTPEIREDYTSAVMLQRGQYGVGFEVEGLGLVRAQYIGKAYKKDGETYEEGDELESYAVINAAVKVDQAIENLYLDVGVFVPTDDDAENTKIAAYSNYKMGALTPHILAEFELDKMDAEGDEELGVRIGIGADVDLGNDLVLTFDARYHNETAVASEDLLRYYGIDDNSEDDEIQAAWAELAEDVESQTCFLIGVTKKFPNGLIGIGFQGTTLDWGPGLVTKEDINDFAWAIPVRLEYSF